MYIITLKKFKKANISNISAIIKRVLIPFYINPIHSLLIINNLIGEQEKLNKKHIKITFYL